MCVESVTFFFFFLRKDNGVIRFNVVENLNHETLNFCFPLCEYETLSVRIALMHVYVTQANFTTKPRFEIKNKRSFTEMNSQGSRVEKNTHAQKVQMQKILFTNEACW